MPKETCELVFRNGVRVEFACPARADAYKGTCDGVFFIDTQADVAVSGEHIPPGGRYRPIAQFITDVGFPLEG